MSRPITSPLAAALALCAFGALRLFAQSTAPWTAKDWHQWTEKDCQEILSSSPWVQTQPIRYYFVPPDAIEDTNVVLTLQLQSALPIRQARERLAAIQQEKGGAPRQQPKPPQALYGEDVSQRFTDSIIVHVVALDKMGNGAFPLGFPTRVFLKLSGLKNYACQRIGLMGQITAPSQSEFNIVCPRTVGGQPVMQANGKTLLIEFWVQQFTGPELAYDFKFALDKMKYEGKLEY
jgi:hypothetical protein